MFDTPCNDVFMIRTEGWNEDVITFNIIHGILYMEQSHGCDCYVHLTKIVWKSHIDAKST